MVNLGFNTFQYFFKILVIPLPEIGLWFVRFVSSPDRFVNFQGHLLTPSDRFFGLFVFVNFQDRFVRVVCDQLI